MAVTLNSIFTCNTIGFLSNKGEKPSKIKIPTNRIAVRYKHLNIAVLKPIIDKLTFGFSPTVDFLKQHDPVQNLEEYKRHIKKSLFQDAMDADNTAIEVVQNVPFKKAPYKHYNANLRYTPPSASESIFIQVDPKEGNGQRPFLRFDMNPSQFSKKALLEFRAFIEETLFIPGAHISYDDFIRWAKIYRADVAVDIVGVRPSELEILALKGKEPFPQKSHVYKSKTGRAQTVYPKAKQGESSDVYVYDKRREQIDRGVTPIYGDFLHSRYECRIKDTTFQKLPNIQNRCNRISIRSVDYCKLSKLHYTHHLFIRHALHRTLDKALELIPNKYKSKYKQSYNITMHNIWDAGKLWSYWKDAVENSGLFFSKN